VLVASHHDCEVVTELGASPLSLDLDADRPALPDCDAADSSPLDSAPASPLDWPLLALLPLASPPLDVVDLPLPLPVALDASWAVELERAFEEADSAGSCPEASWT